MKWTVMLLSILATGCSTTTTLSGVPGPMTGNPLRPVYVDCAKAVSTIKEMENVIANPSNPNTYWDQIFATLNGNQTSQQRRSSAKTVLWSARTQCYAI
jgi:hypothetical protein